MTATAKKRSSFGGWVKRLSTSSNSNKRSVPKDVFPPPLPNGKGVFGVPLSESICYARATVGYVDEDAVKHQRAGVIPLVIAKTGYYLKTNALDTEGIFRHSGNLKRVNALQAMFDDPSLSYGLHTNWNDCTPHDVASVLRRYLNKLPEPVIPHNFYEAFRDVMSDKYQCTTEDRVHAFQKLIQRLPLPNQHLLLYLLDLMNLFASHSSENKMNASNLAIVFSPAILSHPSHNSPVQYKVSQRVLEFLVEFQALFTMQLLFQKKKSTLPPVPSHIPLVVSPQSIQTQKPTSPSIVRHEPNSVASEANIHPEPPQPRQPSPMTKPPSTSDQESSYSADSGTDVRSVHRTPKPQPGVLLPSDPLPGASRSAERQSTDENGIASQDSDDAMSTPRAGSPRLSPSNSRTPVPFQSIPNHDSQQEPRDVVWIKTIFGAVGIVLYELSRPRGGKPLGFWGFGIAVFTVIAVVGYEAYQAVWGMCCFEPYVFFTGFALYWFLLVWGIHWQAVPVVDEYQEEEFDEDDGLSLFEDISIAQDQTLEEIMLRDAKCEWHSLLTRSWRTEFPDTDDASDMISIISMASRFREEVSPGDQQDEDDDNEDSDMDIDDIPFDELLQRYQRIQNEAMASTRLLYKEHEPSQGREHVPIPLSQQPPVKEEWKIRTFKH